MHDALAGNKTRYLNDISILHSEWIDKLVCFLSPRTKNSLVTITSKVNRLKLLKNRRLYRHLTDV